MHRHKTAGPNAVASASTKGQTMELEIGNMNGSKVVKPDLPGRQESAPKYCRQPAGACAFSVSRHLSLLSEVGRAGSLEVCVRERT